MRTTTKITILIAAAIVLIIIVAIVLFLPGDQGQAKSTAERFAKEFGTYDERNPSDYDTRMRVFLDDSYESEFFSKYAVINSGEADYQRIDAVTSRVTSVRGEFAQVEVELSGVKSDPPARAAEFETSFKVSVTVEKKDGEWLVTFVGFAP